eukprot:1140457-Pelagomonas_calceolata.AAC.3
MVVVLYCPGFPQATHPELPIPCKKGVMLLHSMLITGLLLRVLLHSADLAAAHSERQGPNQLTSE